MLWETHPARYPRIPSLRISFAAHTNSTCPSITPCKTSKLVINDKLGAKFALLCRLAIEQVVSSNIGRRATLGLQTMHRCRLFAFVLASIALGTLSISLHASGTITSRAQFGIGEKADLKLDGQNLGDEAKIKWSIEPEDVPAKITGGGKTVTLSKLTLEPPDIMTSYFFFILRQLVYLWNSPMGIIYDIGNVVGNGELSTKG
jgi:hypothetical protein